MRFDKLSLLGLLLAQIATAAAAQDVYPLRVVRLAHGFAAGGNADTVSRIIANEMSRGLGQSVIVEPRPGAGGNIASAAAAKSTADGYTMVLLTGGHTVSAALYKSLQFDPVEDFVFISTVTKFPFFIAVRPNTFGSLQELITKAQAIPGGVTFGSAGVGTTQHLTGELLAQQSGTRFTHVPYPGGAPATTALLRGEIDVLVDTGAGLAGQAAAGAIRTHRRLLKGSLEPHSSNSDRCRNRLAGLRYRLVDRPGGAGRNAGVHRREVARRVAPDTCGSRGAGPPACARQRTGTVQRRRHARADQGASHLWTRVVTDAGIEKR